jgi:hypothetical protein
VDIKAKMEILTTETQSGSVVWKLLGPEEKQEKLVRIVSTTFDNNPIVQDLDLTGKMDGFCNVMVEHALQQGLSFVGEIAGEIACFALCFDAATEPTTGSFENSFRSPPESFSAALAEVPDLSVIFEFLEALHPEQHVTPQHSFHLFMGGTVAGSEGHGLGVATRQIACHVAHLKGFSEVIVEAANPATVHIWTKYCDGVTIRSLEATEWERALPSGEVVRPLKTPNAYCFMKCTPKPFQ